MPDAVVRRAAMLAGTTAEVARLAAAGGVEALEQVGLVVGRPVRADARRVGEDRR